MVYNFFKNNWNYPLPLIVNYLNLKPESLKVSVFWQLNPLKCRLRKKKLMVLEEKMQQLQAKLRSGYAKMQHAQAELRVRLAEVL
jgi:predicted aconitase